MTEKETINQIKQAIKELRKDPQAMKDLKEWMELNEN